MATFEKLICDIDNAVSIKKEDREVYTKDFDIIRNYLLHIMQEEDEVFKKIYSGPSLFGNYAENMKIGSPDEFDVHFLLKLPFYEHTQIKSDGSRPGFVRLNFSKVLALMKSDPNLCLVYKKFNGFVTKKQYLCRNRIQNWFTEIIKRALQINGNAVQSSTGEMYTLDYLTRGTAHTIKAESINRDISIDFVPAFKFDANSEWLADRPFPKDVKEKLWFAVPKPTVGPKKGRFLTFSICVPQAEKHLLTNKYNLKISLRLLKSLRDKVKGYPLKSYFIRSLYLKENDIQSDDFWKQPPGELLIHMIDRVLDCLNVGFIPFYWCPKLNLLGGLIQPQINEIKVGFERVKDILDSCRAQAIVDKRQLRRLFGTTTKALNKEFA